MKVVIDTSVLVSAAFRDRTPEEVILFVTEQDAFHWIVSGEAVQEIKMKSVMSTYIRRILVVALTTDVMGIPGWGFHLLRSRPLTEPDKQKRGITKGVALCA